MNRLVNIAVGYRSKKSAKQVLHLLLADEVREEKRKEKLKARAALMQTDEAKAAKAEKQRQTNEKRKKTIANKKIRKEMENNGGENREAEKTSARDADRNAAPEDSMSFANNAGE